MRVGVGVGVGVGVWVKVGVGVGVGGSRGGCTARVGVGVCVLAPEALAKLCVWRGGGAHITYVT